MTTTSFGASIGRGPVHCVLLEWEDGEVVGQQTRTIDPGPYRLGRRSDLLASGFDLLAARAERPVDASAVAVRTRRDLLAARFGIRGELRAAEVVRETDAVLRALDDSGAIARYSVTLIADIGAGGMRVHTVTDGAVTATARTTAVAVSGTEPGFDTPSAAAEFVRGVVDGAGTPPEALVLIGGGAQHAAIREAISGVARTSHIETVDVDEPEAVAATGAALLAADRTAGAAPAGTARLGSGFGAFGGHSVRLTATILPVLVVAALAFAVLITTYATGLIGPTGDSTDRLPLVTDATTSDAVQGSTTREEFTSTTTTLAGGELVVPTNVPRDHSRDEVTVPPVMTTFAPPPTAPRTRTPGRTVGPLPTTPTVPSTPGTGWPTILLPTPPTGSPTTGTPSPTSPGVPTTGGTGTPTAPSPTSEHPPLPIVGGGAHLPEGASGPDVPPAPVQPSAGEQAPESPTVTTPAA
ncbi:hypothetical protein [Tsukamurella strandjordii]|uniref:hypothetical protein n=1 Tax=Tsukamurella strandjordii TaxID=147577 RepID=UPI0031DDF1D1